MAAWVKSSGVAGHDVDHAGDAAFEQRGVLASCRRSVVCTISDGSRVKLTLRPTVWYWSRMNQSPVATLWPSTVTWVRLGERAADA